jgi:hypothetical protein
MTVLKKELQAVRREIKSLEKKIQKLRKAAEVGSKGRQGRVVKTSIVKSAKSAATKQSAGTKKSFQMTAAEQILRIIKRYRKGVDVSTLKTKTGFDDKKVRNIVFRASKEGKIKKSSRGIYVMA